MISDIWNRPARGSTLRLAVNFAFMVTNSNFLLKSVFQFLWKKLKLRLAVVYGIQCAKSCCKGHGYTQLWDQRSGHYAECPNVKDLQWIQFWLLVDRLDSFIYRHLFSLVFLSCGENDIQYIPTEIGRQCVVIDSYFHFAFMPSPV